MNDTVVIALSRFKGEAERVAKFLGADVRVYTPTIFVKIFPHTRRIVAIMSMGIVVRRIAPLVNNKWNDPAVVVVSPDLAYAIPVIGGHHGANDLAKELSAMGIHPVITTVYRGNRQGFRRSNCSAQSCVRSLTRTPHGGLIQQCSMWMFRFLP